jgi:hypothetical protein
VQRVVEAGRFVRVVNPDLRDLERARDQGRRDDRERHLKDDEHEHRDGRVRRRRIQRDPVEHRLIQVANHAMEVAGEAEREAADDNVVVPLARSRLPILWCRLRIQGNRIRHLEVSG